MNIELKDILDRKVERSGCFETTTTYLRGRYPEGREIDGYTGPETVFEERRIKPIFVFGVTEDKVDDASS